MAENPYAVHFGRPTSPENPYAGLLAREDAGWTDLTPYVQRRKKPGGGWEYRTNPAHPPPGPATLSGQELPGTEDPYANRNVAGMIAEQVVGRAADQESGLGDMYLGAEEGFRGIADVAKRRLANPNVGDEALQTLLDAEKERQAGTRGPASLVASALTAPKVDPIGAGRATVDAIRGEPREKFRQSMAARGHNPYLTAFADTGLEAAALGVTAAADPANLGLMGPKAAAAAAPRVLSEDFAREARLGLRAHPDEAGELARASLPIGEPGWTPPPPRLPLDELPDPARFPLREFEQLSPLPPPSTAAVHRLGVEQAVEGGERVRPAVLADYPDLAADVAVAAARPGERGHVKIPAGPGFLDRWFTRDGDFQALGELKGWAFERSQVKDREISAGSRKVADTLRDFNVGMKQAVKETSLSPDEIFDYVEAGIKGENDLSGIPPNLRAATEEMRLHWDQASDAYVQRTDLPQALRDTIEANRGSYYPRHFRVHEDPEWARLVDPSSPAHDPRERWRWDEFQDWSHTANPDWEEADHVAYAQHLLSRDPDAFVGVSRGEGAVGRENRGNLKRRILADATVDDLPPELAARVQAGTMTLDGAVVEAKQLPGWWEDFLAHNHGLPAPIDNLLGLYKDPSLRYRSSMMRTVHDQAVYKLHHDLAGEGIGTIFHPDRQPGFFTKIGGKGPLAELHTSPEIAAVLRGSQSTSKAFHGWAAGLFEGWKKVRSGVSLAKTSLNIPSGHVRNAAAWPFIHLAEGHFGAATNPIRPLKLLPYQIADKASTQQGAIAGAAKRMADMVELADGTRLGERWSMDLKELRPEIEFLRRQGVFGESAHGADLRHYEGVLGFGQKSRERKFLEWAVQGSTSLWEGGDDIGKHISFRANLQNLLWADGKMGIAESLPADYWTRAEFQPAIEKAAERTRLATPTRSMISPAVKQLRDLPAGPFPGWTAEQFRNAKENVRLGLADMRDPNPRMKVLGAKRLGGFLASSALASSLRTGAKAGKWALLGGGIAGLVNLARGTDDDPGDALRSFVAPWSRDSEIAVTDVDKGGKVRSVDLSSLIPAAAYMDGASAILRSIQDGNNYWDGFVDGTQETLNPFFDEEIAVSTVLDLARNKKGSGWFEEMMNQARTHPYKSPDYPVYDENADRLRKSKQVLYHLYRNVAPGGVVGLQGERLVRAAAQDNPEVRDAFANLTDYDRALSIQDEAQAMMGLRFTTTDVSRSVARQGGDYGRQRIQISSAYARRKQPAGLAVASPERALELKKEANDDGRRAHEMLVRSVANALRLGFNQEQVRQWLGDGNVGKKHRTALLMDAQRYLQGQPVQFYIPVVP